MDQILERAKAGDKDAENELFAHLLVRFRLIAKRKVWEAGEELAQEACLTVLKKYRTEDFTVSFEAWALGVLKNIIGNHLREKKRRRDIANSGLVTALARDTCSEEQLHNLRLALLECLKKLDRLYPVYAQILDFGYQGLETAEICRRLKISANNAYVTLNRARAKLKTCLAGGRV